MDFRGDNPAEAFRILNLPIHRRGASKLNAIEDVERFQPKFKRSFSREGDVLFRHEIPILSSGTMKHPALCVSQLAEGLVAEQIGVESRVAISAICIDFERSGREPRRFQKVVVCSVAKP
jgi:hypothetical protein